MTTSRPGYPTGGIHPYVYAYFEGLGDLTGKTVVDVPAGDGRSRPLRARLAQSAFESDMAKNMPPTEVDSIWSDAASDLSPTSIALFPVAYPLVVLTSLFAYLRNRSRFARVPEAERRAIFREHLGINCAPSTLVRKHIVWVLRKQRDLEATRRRLKALTRQTQAPPRSAAGLAALP